MPEKKNYELVVLSKDELGKLESLGKGNNHAEYPTKIMSGVFRGVVGNFLYVPDLNSLVIYDKIRDKFPSLKPKTKGKK